MFVRLVDTFPGMAYRCLHDADWTLEFASDGVEALLGYTADELVVQRTVAISDLTHADDLARVSLEVEKALAAAEPFRCIYRMHTKAGGCIWVSEVGRGVFDEGGDLQAIEGFVSDVTSEVESREAARLVERREIVARMASGVAHDFNNLLIGAQGSVDELRALLPKDLQGAGEELDALSAIAKRASSLTEQLLTFGRPRVAGAEPVDLAGALTELRPVLSRVLGPRVEVDLRVPEMAALSRIDMVAFEQVVLNLVVNAKDAMGDSGRVVIELSAAEDEAWVVVSVTDFGGGIAADALDRVFEPYFTTKDADHGTGLGLATVRAIVEEAGGRIDVHSEVGAGTTFDVRLPRLATTSKGPGGTEVVLLAEDDENVRRILARGLRRLGYTILEAKDGEQAMKISERHKGPLDLLVTDGKMPRIAGLELAKRHRRSRPSVPVILITGDRVSGPPGLFSARLAKPFIVDDLAACMRRVLDDSDAGHEDRP